MDEQEGHEAEVDDVERSLDAMQERSGQLEDDIEGAGDDWERKKRDPAVPGAAGMPSEAGGPEPEAEYPTKDAGEDGDADESEADGGEDPDGGSSGDEQR